MKTFVPFFMMVLCLTNCGTGRNENSNAFSVFDKSKHLKPKINKAEFYKATGFDLGWLLLEPINIAKSPEDEPNLSIQLSPGQKALYFWWYLDAEVTNGGFVQFYFNGKEIYVPAIIEGLELIGDKEMADLTRQADSIYNEHREKVETARANDSFGEELYEELDDLEKLDDAYYSLHDQTMARLERYTKQHASEFCVDEDGNEFKQGFTGVLKSYFENGSIKDVFSLANGEINGKFISYYENGKERSLNNYRNGALVGEQKDWYENGNLRWNIVIDSLTGKRIKETYFESGQLRAIVHTNQHDKRKGPYREWHDNGQLKEQSEFIDDAERIGPMLKFHRNGKKELEAEFKNGEAYFHNYWTAEGAQLMKKGTGLYINEFEMKELNGSTKFRYETEYRNYKRHGLSKSFFDGVIQSTQEFKDGVEHGKSEDYTNGKLTSVRIYEDGKLVSTKQVN